MRNLITIDGELAKFSKPADIDGAADVVYAAIKGPEVIRAMAQVQAGQLIAVTPQNKEFWIVADIQLGQQIAITEEIHERRASSQV